MIKSIFAILLLPALLFGSPYDPSLLQIGAKVFPKIILIEKGTKERILSSLNIVIITNDSSKETAFRLTEYIERNHAKGLTHLPLRVNIVSPKEALNINNAHGFILILDGKESFFPSLLDHAAKTKTLTFCFDPDLLPKGVAVSLYIGRSVKPYLNLSVLRDVPFVFEYGFLKLSQPYHFPE